MDINSLFRMARETQGIKQSDLAKKAGIAQPSLSQFESGMFTLSLDALLVMAPYLNINPDYLLGVSSNPFSSAELIKMKLPEKLLVGVDYSPVEYIVQVNPSVQVAFLLAPTAIDKIISQTALGQLTLAVLARDQDGNIFIFRRRGRGAFFVGEGDLQARLQGMADDGKKTVLIKTHRISRTLAKKISDWDVTLEDVQGLFESSMITRNLSLEENRLLDTIRSQGINPEKVEELVNDLKKKKRTDGLFTI